MRSESYETPAASFTVLCGADFVPFFLLLQSIQLRSLSVSSLCLSSLLLSLPLSFPLSLPLSVLLSGVGGGALRAAKMRKKPYRVIELNRRKDRVEQKKRQDI